MQLKENVIHTLPTLRPGTPHLLNKRLKTVQDLHGKTVQQRTRDEHRNGQRPASIFQIELQLRISLLIGASIRYDMAVSCFRFVFFVKSLMTPKMIRWHYMYSRRLYGGTNEKARLTWPTAL